jgi:endo-1,4-beta-D-glucanase Y
MQKNKILIFSIIFISLFLVACKINSNEKNKKFLKKSYELYKHNFMSKDGRIMDADKNNITTSEAQAYLMLRAYLIEDKTTFDLAYKWTKNNLQRKDKLFAWLWGQNQKGEYKILDDNSAADADVDIAFALLSAYKKWKNYIYLEEAMYIINSIWINEVKEIDNHLILMPGFNQTLNKKIEINPSYFSPAAFRLFQKYDMLHDWNLLVESSYFYLKEVMSKTKTNLPPNWFLIENNQIILENSPSSDFSYDAIRIFARIYLDFIQTHEIRALDILKKSEIFVQQWKNSKTFYVNYKVDGNLRDKHLAIGSMSILIPAISVYNPEIAKEIYQKTIKPYFDDETFWKNTHNYYNNNLSWFAQYLYTTNLNGYR